MVKKILMNFDEEVHRDLQQQKARVCLAFGEKTCSWERFFRTCAQYTLQQLDEIQLIEYEKLCKQLKADVEENFGYCDKFAHKTIDKLDKLGAELKAKGIEFTPYHDETRSVRYNRITSQNDTYKK